MRIRAYREADAEKWDELASRSACGTFLHTRRFLTYHGRRFADASIVCEDDKGGMIGVLPAALKPDDSVCVASHPGATYGGLISSEGYGADRIEEMLAGIVEYYRAKGLRSLEYKSVPPHLHSSYSQADQQALWKFGAKLARRDLWNVLSLGDRPGYSKHHGRAVQRARKGGVTIRVVDSDAAYRAFHGALEALLDNRYGVSPVHTTEEMLMLRDRFPRDIALWLAQDGDGQLLAGCWVFMHAKKAWHTQYIASTPEGRDCCATHLMFDGLIREAEKSGVGFVSFGSSTEDGGRRLNTGLYDFKMGFGAGSVCHDIYRLKLE